MKSKETALWILFLIGVGIAAAGFILTPDFLVANLATNEVAKLSGREISAIRTLRAVLIAGGFLLVVFSIALHWIGGRVARTALDIFQLESRTLEGMSSAAAAIDLFLISFLGLFFETLIIRWLSTEIRLFAYYKNLPLIAAFMGLGVGFMLARKKLTLLPIFPIAFCVLSSIILIGAARGVFTSLSNPAGSDIWLWGILQRSMLPSILSFYAVIPFFFLFTVLVFIPLGQRTGQYMRLFAPIRAYSINIFGSLVGVWAFSALSFLSWPPFTWFCAGLVLCLWLLRGFPRALLINAVVSVLFIAMAFLLRGDSYWSPYYRVDVEPIQAKDVEGEQIEWGYALDVNYDFHQLAVDLSPRFVHQHASLFPEAVDDSAGYAMPYQIIKPRNVLVVGAGAGNDVATALRLGAEHVDAVEIDPVIMQIGRDLHPEKPYDSPRVTLIVDDARSYFKKTSKEYDLVVYGLLDSHTLFSSMSSLRLDNFVYTVEGITEAKKHLADDGAMAIFFLAGKEWIAQRLFNMIAVAFGEEPTMLATSHGNLYLVGPGFDRGSLRSIPSGTRYEIVDASYDTGTELAVDDWPMLYLRERGIPRAYWQVLLLLALVSMVVILAVSPKSLDVNWHFFLLGSAFLLLEVKSITDLALLFGSTWIVNSVVISAILFMILAANFYVQRFRLLDVRIYYALLIVSLLLSYFVPLQTLLGQNVWLKAVLGSLIISLPLFFAGIIFAGSLKKTTSVEVAFGSNLLGAVLGGLLEYSSLIFGLSNLVLLALALYDCTWVLGLP